MTRRPSTRIDPAVDLTYHYLTVEALTQKVTSANFFAGDCDDATLPHARPLEIEVGSGKGLFLETQTQRHPDRLYVGNELAFGYAKLAAYRLAKAGVRNGKMVQGDGLRMFAEFVEDQAVDAIHVYFPDPWWKERHRKRRVMRPSFIADIQRTLKPGGVFHFWSDVEEYFESTAELMAQHCSLSGPHFVPEPESVHDRDFRTHFERRMRRNDHPVFRSTYHKAAETSGGK